MLNFKTANGSVMRFSCKILRLMIKEPSYILKPFDPFWTKLQAGVILTPLCSRVRSEKPTPGRVDVGKSYDPSISLVDNHSQAVDSIISVLIMFYSQCDNQECVSYPTSNSHGWICTGKNGHLLTATWG